MVHTRGVENLRRILFVTLLAIAVGGRAFASPSAEARAYHEKAKSAFALEKYAQAAEYFERAFELKADPAILYNAALSHRLAGNKDRALALYQNYLRVFGHVGKWTEVEARVAELKTAIAEDQALAPPPAKPVEAAGGGEANATVAGTEASPQPPHDVRPPALSSPSGAGEAPVLVAKPSDDANGDSDTPSHGGWFWVGIGGAVAVAAGAVVLGIVLSQPKDPTPTWGAYTAGRP
jgi:hypothetical protein